MYFEQPLADFLIKGFAICIVFSVTLLLSFRIFKIKLNKYVYIALVVLLFTWDNIYVGVATYSLCWKEGGMRINKVVENVTGYYENSDTLGCAATCETHLFVDKYKFVEMKVFPANKRFLAETPGLYRFYLVQRGSPLCKLYYEKYPTKKEEPYCIAAEKVIKLESEYSYQSYLNEKVRPFILKTTSTVTDRRTGEELARATTFMNYAGWVNYLNYSAAHGNQCPDTSIHYKILNRTLRTNKD